MTKFKKAVLGAAAAMALAAPVANAGLADLAGVLVDPDYTDGGEVDFISQFNFTQWYSATNSPETDPATITNYNSAVSISTVLGTLDGTSSATGYYLQGTGEFYRINGLSTSNGDIFCPGCELTYAFGGIGLNKDSTFDISGAWAKVYIDYSPDYSHPLSNAPEVAKALDGDVWLDLDFTSLSFVSGTVQNGVVSATFNIVGGLAASYFDPQTLEYTADAAFAIQNTKYSTGGNGSAYGNTAIPEPATLALLGIGLLGMGGMSARKRVKA